MQGKLYKSSRLFVSIIINCPHCVAKLLECKCSFSAGVLLQFTSFGINMKQHIYLARNKVASTLVHTCSLSHAPLNMVRTSRVVVLKHIVAAVQELVGQHHKSLLTPEQALHISLFSASVNLAPSCRLRRLLS